LSQARQKSWKQSMVGDVMVLLVVGDVDALMLGLDVDETWLGLKACVVD
jgi:hypothetical protein